MAGPPTVERHPREGRPGPATRRCGPARPIRRALFLVWCLLVAVEGAITPGWAATDEVGAETSAAKRPPAKPPPLSVFTWTGGRFTIPVEGFPAVGEWAIGLTFGRKGTFSPGVGLLISGDPPYRAFRFDVHLAWVTRNKRVETRGGVLLSLVPGGLIDAGWFPMPAFGGFVQVGRRTPDRMNVLGVVFLLRHEPNGYGLFPAASVGFVWEHGAPRKRIRDPRDRWSL